MFAKKRKIENDKSIEKPVIDTHDQINVLMGENSVGKSNVFDAITLSLGPVYHLLILLNPRIDSIETKRINSKTRTL